MISAGAAITAGILGNDPAFFSTKKEYDITYVLDGGLNSADNPQKYTEGVGTQLYAAEKEGYVFIGWFLDEEYEEEITEISKDSKENITLYACWERSEIGNSYTFTIAGNTVRYTGPFRTDTPISGNVTYTYLTYRYGKGYYMNYDRTLTTGTGRFASTASDSEQYWSGELDTVWEKGENKVIDTIHGTKECSTWVSRTSSSVETQYLGLDNDVTYLIEYTETNGRNSYSITYTLTETNQTVIDDHFNVDVYCDKGVTVTGCGTLDAYNSVTLTASGEFYGWYNTSGTLLSTSRTYTVDILLSDIVLYARNNNDKDLSFDTPAVTATPDVPLTDITWTLNDNGTEITRTGETLSYTFSQAGSYVLLYTGTDTQGNTYHGLYDVYTDGPVTKTYQWSYSNQNYEATLNIVYSDYLEYKNRTISRSQGTTEHDVSFVTYEDPYIDELVTQIQSQCVGKTDVYIANVMLAFTQYIEYMYDSDSVGQEEYWKYPLETLFEENGDCEDTSFLFCALAKNAGYDCALILYSGHMAAGVYVDGATGYYYESNSVRYYYSETTVIGWKIGDTPNSDLRMRKVMPVS